MMVAADHGISLYGNSDSPIAPVVILNTEVVLTGALTPSGGITATTTAADGQEGFLFHASGTTAVDNVISIYNTCTGGGNATICGYRPLDGGFLPSNSAAWALGFGGGSTRGTPTCISDRVFIGLSPKGTSNTDDPPDFVLEAESDKGSGYIGRVIWLFDAVAKVSEFRGWSNSAALGPLGLQIATDGTATIGTLLKLTPRTVPGTPANGMVYIDSGDNHMYARINGAWKQLDN